VLALLRGQPRYGFDLVRALGAADGLVTTTWHESPSGPPRRYYQVTGEGRRALALFADEWDRFTRAVDQLLQQGGSS
jgi:PadR family transcriptional regulator